MMNKTVTFVRGSICKPGGYRVTLLIRKCYQNVFFIKCFFGGGDAKGFAIFY